MNNEICSICKKPMGNSGSSDLMGNPTHIKCLRKREDRTKDKIEKLREKK